MFLKRFGGAGRGRKGPNNVDRTRLNERIRVSEVRLIDESGQQLGVMVTREALALAKERGLDLVEVAPESNPPVCRIQDYGKVKYSKKKKEQEARKKQSTVDIKKIQIRPRIGEHDFDVKYRHMKNFLERGDKVKVVLIFRGREIAYAKKQGNDILGRIVKMAQDYAVLESEPKLEGRYMTMVLGPIKGKKRAAQVSLAEKNLRE